MLTSPHLRLMDNAGLLIDSFEKRPIVMGRDSVKLCLGLISVNVEFEM